ncbi:MAG: redoxin family protein [Puniceicoccales bacterium]|jgi:nucleoredoxin|nr:redoxin family protein [Puniceicoccales bacterium]
MKKFISLLVLALAPAMLVQAAPATTKSGTTAKKTTATKVDYHPTLHKALNGHLTRAKGKIDYEGLRKKKYLFLYFSASWCGPCKKFTPQLIDFYEKNTKNDDFEVILVSSDRTQKAMTAYMKENKMPWPGLRLTSRSTKDLQKKFGGKGIPCLVLLDEKDKVLAHSYQDGEYVGPNNALRKYKSLHSNQP